MVIEKLYNILNEDKYEEIDLKEKKYYFNGIPVPRVTEIISKMISEEYLLYWANSLGFKKQGYKQTVQKAADIGSNSHDLINRFISGETFESSDIPYLAFRKWWIDITSSNIVNVLGAENTITCQYFGGTYDLLVEINGKVYLVDFKTSNHVGYKYFIQLAAYIYMLEQQGINVHGCIILQLDKNEICYTEYVLDFENKEHLEFINRCTTTFLSLVYGYYNITRCENLFNQIF